MAGHIGGGSLAVKGGAIDHGALRGEVHYKPCQTLGDSFVPSCQALLFYRQPLDSVITEAGFYCEMQER